jgi:hypothetical protein
VPAAVKAVAAFVLAVAVDVVAGLTGQVELIYVGNLLQAYALGQLITALVGTPSRNTAPAPQQFMANGSTYPRTIIYGTTRVSGVIVYERLKP